MINVFTHPSSLGKLFPVEVTLKHTARSLRGTTFIITLLFNVTAHTSQHNTSQHIAAHHITTQHNTTQTRPHRVHTPCVWRLCRPPSHIKLLLLMSLSIYGCGPSANSFHIIMAAERLVWLARPSHKCPEAQNGTDCLQKTRKCRFNHFYVVAAVGKHIQTVGFFFCETYFSGATRALESALIVQTAQKCGWTN